MKKQLLIVTGLACIALCTACQKKVSDSNDVLAEIPIQASEEGSKGQEIHTESSASESEAPAVQEAESAEDVPEEPVPVTPSESEAAAVPEDTAVPEVPVLEPEEPVLEETAVTETKPGKKKAEVPKKDDKEEKEEVTEEEMALSPTDKGTQASSAMDASESQGIVPGTVDPDTGKVWCGDHWVKYTEYYTVKDDWGIEVGGPYYMTACVTNHYQDDDYEYEYRFYNDILNNVHEETRKTEHEYEYTEEWMEDLSFQNGETVMTETLYGFQKCKNCGHKNFKDCKVIGTK